jgi:hypothetical protein
MIRVTAKFEGVQVGGLGGGSLDIFRRRQMEKIGNFALRTVIERTKRGIGSDGAAMPPLSTKRSAVLGTSGKGKGRVVRIRDGYAGYKAKHGLQPIRDLVGDGKQGGHMLDNPSVRSVTDSTAKIAFTSRSARIKALANERRTPFFSFSADDETKIAAYARTLFAEAVRSFRTDMFKGRRRAA